VARLRRRRRRRRRRMETRDVVHYSVLGGKLKARNI
jgi:hypothetical protein